MPLTVQCYCPGDSNVSVCALYDLVFAVDITYSSIGSSDHGFYHYVNINDATNSWEACTGGTCVTGHYEHSIFGWDWASLYVTFSGQSTALKPHVAGEFAQVTYSWKIIQKYSCSKTGGTTTYKEITAHSNGADSQSCNVGDVVVWLLNGSGSGGTIAWFASSPFHPECWDATSAHFNDFEPKPLDSSIDMGTTTTWCACADGGTPPYHFSLISGDGWHIDPTTGCLTNDPDANFSQPITIMVVDSASETATVECVANPPECTDTAVGNSFY